MDDEARRYLAAIVESSGDAIIGKDLDGIITAWNRGAERIYGYTAEETIGRPISMLVPPEIQNDVPAIMERLRRGERIQHYETIRAAKDGRRLNISLTISPIRGADGTTIVGASTIARDITQQKRTEADLRDARAEAESEAERARRLQRVTAALTATIEPGEVLDIIIDEVIDATGAIAAGIVELTADGREFVTLRARGFDRERLRNYRRFPVDRPTPVRDVARTAKPVFLHSVEEWNARYPSSPSTTGGAGAWAALPLRARDRLLGAITLSFPGPREFPADEREHVMALAHQCAEALDRAQLYAAERQAKREAEEASRAKSHFLAVMSHELRTPLTAILGYSSLLNEEVVGSLNERQKEQVRRVRESGRHLLELIDQILSLSRIEAGREEITLEEFDASELARAAGNMVRPLADRAGLGFQVDLPDSPVEMKTDAGKIRQILLNLLSNAVKFTDEGEVRFGLRADRESAVFQVSDTGPGISGEDRDRIFSPFEQVDRGRTRSKGGAGLGLSVSLELARMLGGELVLDSEPGRGSTFTVRLPRRFTPTQAS